MKYLQTVFVLLLINAILYANAAGKTFTMAQVKSQKLTVISGNVYDLSKWSKTHPGGPEKIQSIMGVDGTAVFKKKHGLDYVKLVKSSMLGTVAKAK
jgi:cytochrome b involved in lipid metabolism